MTAGRADVVIAGAGALGLSIAFELARRSVDVVVFDRGVAAGRGTSALAAAAGMVNPQAHPGVEPEPVRDLALLSRHLYADWIESIESEGGMSCEYDARGGLTVALTEGQEVELDRSLDWQRARGLPFEVLSADGGRGREPQLGPGVRAAFFFPHEGQVPPARLGRALALAALSAGVRILEGTPVFRVLSEGGRAVGVETSAGRFDSEFVVNAMGAWSGALEGAPSTPVTPVRGQAVALDASADPDRLSRFVFAPGVYLVPRRDGTVIVGSTLERVGFDVRVTAGGVSSILERASRVVPAILGYPLVDAWAGLRPATPDEIPVLGETALTGYFLASGHYKNGVLLAPASAVVMADLLTRERPPLPIAPFSPGRFD